MNKTRKRAIAKALARLIIFRCQMALFEESAVQPWKSWGMMQTGLSPTLMTMQGGGQEPKIKQAGNSVTVNVIEAIAKQFE
ncbi:hypothetical protein [Streptococcus canis]|uniref:hypothetical protein n=1 Tax=Streptococcus canis TaxID=1329 RepID=UPI0024DE6AFC|nr:hypothetical protein [Streptococcus canis]